MANIRSQIKRIRTNAKAQERNKAVRTELKTYIKRFRDAAQSGDADAAQEAYRLAARKLDKAASKGVIHANNAAHRKSKMASKLGALTS